MKTQSFGKKSSRWKSLFLAGILPLIIFTLIEEYFGTLWGLIAGMIFGVGEILWEWKTLGKVNPMTWGGNGLLLFLGGISLFTQEGVWFKLQPAFIEAGFSLILWGSLIMGKSFLWSLLQKQKGEGWEKGLRPEVKTLLPSLFHGVTFRLGLFFILHAMLATWAALRWSTAAWVLLKGVGLTVSLLFYVVAESFILRFRLKKISIRD